MLRLLLILATALVCLATPGLGGPVAAARVQDDEIVREFKKYYKKYKDVPTQVEAVLSLEGVESAEVVGALVGVLKRAEPDVIEAAVRVLSGFESAEPAAAVVAELEGSSNQKVTEVLLRAVAAGGYPGADGTLLGLLADRSWGVRLRALDAVSRLGAAGSWGQASDPEGEVEEVPLDPAIAIAPLAADPEPAVRSAAFDALARLRAPSTVGLALEALSDPVWQVRASAVEALGVVRSREAIGPLIDRMALEEGRLLADIGATLFEITGRNFGVRVEQWQSFWETFSERFEIPSDAELAKLRALQEARKQEYKPGDGTAYHGVVTPSRSIVFVIDVSGSMENLVVDTERFEGGGYPSMLRIDIVKTELQRTIDALEPYVEFNILSFATKVRRWKKSLVKANVLNKSSAVDWVGRLEALGGASKAELASAGLVGAANLGAGKTNTYDALMEALEAPAPGKSDKDYEVGVDTIFFLSDGRPSHGAYIDPQDILREVRRVNELRKVVIHTIALGEFQKEFMRQLAAENGGVFVDLGR